MLSHEHIKEAARRAGFDLCGITRSRHFADNEAAFRRWIEAGYSGGLGYLARNLDKRFDPSTLVDGARSVVVCAVNYRNPVSGGYPAGSKAKIASYACTTDYHTTIKAMLHSMFAELKRKSPSLGGRAFVDSAPLLEKQLAVDAGLGWIGRHSLLITPQFGSFVLLGELVLTKETDLYDSPIDGGCGECRKCIDSCPAKALLPDRMVDASRCISCATVESQVRRCDSDSRHPLHGWIFGCDECQSCCPHNHKPTMHTNAAFDMIFNPLEILPEAWVQMSDGEFNSRFGSTPLARCGVEALKRNLAE